jgi:glycerol-3-phosphate acyltransferase PlsY
MREIFSILLGYLIGSIPFSFIVAKLKGLDLRERVKNGQIGASAVKRNCGIFPAILAGSGDFSKGALAVFLARKLTKQDWIIVLSALAAIIGHNWSIYLKFWGGKGALVSFGCLISLLFWPFLASIYLLFPYFLVKRKIILGMKKTDFFTYLGYLSISFFGLLFGFSLPLIFGPILSIFPMALKKNY